MKKSNRALDFGRRREGPGLNLEKIQVPPDPRQNREPAYLESFQIGDAEKETPPRHEAGAGLLG